MADGKFAVGQIGAKFIVKWEEDTLSGHIGFDITQAEVSDIEHVFTTPDKRTKKVTATIRAGTTDESESVTTDANFLDVDGPWKYRGLITTTSGDTLHYRFFIIKNPDFNTYY